MGDWVAEGGGDTGAGTGSFSFHPDLQGRVLVRKNVADYPAQSGRPAYRHDDLMIIYPDAQGRPARAIFFDNESHVINYTVQTASDGRGAIFVGDIKAGEPRFRLSYRVAGDKVEGLFEIAPPGKPEAFAKYLQWTAHRAVAAR